MLTLQSTLRVTVDGDVTFLFDVWADAVASTTIIFDTAQLYDIVVRDSSGTTVWRWGADRMFAQMLSTRLLDAGATWTIAERWSPTVRGALTAEALLTSGSHAAGAAMAFTVP